MTKRKLPSQEYLNKLFYYHPKTGNLYRRIQTSPRTKVGDLAGSKTRGGYISISIDGATYGAHRIVWKMITGKDPHEIDHINNHRDDNRIENLRSVSRKDNMRNKRMRRDNKSGTTGVFYVARDKRWRACIGTGGKQEIIGLYREYEEAVMARKAKEKLYGYTKIHGKQHVNKNVIFL